MLQQGPAVEVIVGGVDAPEQSFMIKAVENRGARVSDRGDDSHSFTYKSGAM